MSDFPRLQDQPREIPIIFPDSGVVVYMQVGTSLPSTFTPDYTKIHKYSWKKAMSPEREARASVLEETRQEKKSGLRQALQWGASLAVLATACCWGAGSFSSMIIQEVMRETAEASAQGKGMPWGDALTYAFPLLTSWGMAGIICAYPAEECWDGIKKFMGKKKSLGLLTETVRQTERDLAEKDPVGFVSALPQEKPSRARRMLRRIAPWAFAK